MAEASQPVPDENLFHPVATTSDPTEASLSTLATPTQTLSPTVTASATPIPSAIPVTPTNTSTPGPQIIGYSVEDRPIEVWRFGSGSKQRVIVAGIHGGYEWNTVALADELIAYLEVHPETVPPEVSLFILEDLNPDGEARDHGPDGRTNTHGVDLNRNFPTNWVPDWPRSGCWQLRPVTAGTEPASEPETQALIYFIQSHRIEALISYHSAGLGIFPGGKPSDLASTRLAEALAEVSDYPYPPVDTGCIFTGLLADWLSSQGIPAVDIELSNHRDTDFQMNLAILETFLVFEP